MDWEKHLEKNPIQKIGKTVKIRVNKKPLPRNRIFVQTPFSHSTLKLEQKYSRRKKTTRFSLHFLFRRDKNHHCNLTSKIMKMCEQILKKNEAGHVLTYNSNNFHWLNRKLDLERTMNELENQLERNLIQKTEKTVKIKVKLPHGNKKPPARNWIFVQTPFSHSTLK